MGVGSLESGPRKNRIHLVATILSLIFLFYTLKIFPFHSTNSLLPSPKFSSPSTDSSQSSSTSTTKSLPSQSPAKSWSRAQHRRPGNFARWTNDFSGENAGHVDHAQGSPPKVYRPRPQEEPEDQRGIIDNFPQADHASNLPQIPPWNQPPQEHVNVSTPLLIGFTRGWLQLQQVVVAYINAGWPPEDIYVVDNTGTMHSNRNGLLSLQNPFFLNHTRLTEVFGVHVIETPTLLTFSQMQNFFTKTALDRYWKQYFWSHMDVVPISDEDYDFTDTPYKSLYMRAVDFLHEVYDKDEKKWGLVWFEFDHLSLVHTDAYVNIGGWDTMIPFYQSDCDMHERIWMNGYHIWSTYVGKIIDTNIPLEDLSILYGRDGDNPSEDNAGDEEAAEAGDDEEGLAEEEENAGLRNRDVYVEPHLVGPAYRSLLQKMDELAGQKAGGDMRNRDDDLHQRNNWQRAQRGGQGEPFYRDPDGFQRAIDTWTNVGWYEIWMDKWGIEGPFPRSEGLVLRDAWLVEREWTTERVQQDLADGKLRSERDTFGNKLKWDAEKSGPERDGLRRAERPDETEEDAEEEEEEEESE